MALGLALGPTGAGRALALAPTDDEYFVFEDQSLVVSSATGVLANDGAAGTACVALNEDPVIHGSVNLNPNGGFTFDPESNYHGLGLFKYDVHEPCLAITPDPVHPTVSIIIYPVNDPPAIASSGGCGSGNVNVQEDSGAYDSACVSVTNFGPSNESTQALAEWVVLAESTVGFSSGPTITTNGRLQFTPNGNECGTANLSVAARDNGGVTDGGIDTSTAVEFSINVACANDAPSAIADSFSALKDRTLNISAPGVLTNDTDVEQSPLTAVLQTTTTHGVLTLASNGSFSYTPQSGYTGPDAFSYRASDGSLQSATRVVTLNVSAVATPTPGPTAAPTAVPTAGPTAAPSAEASPSASLDASPSIEPSASAGAATPSAEASAAAPTATAAPEPAGSGGGISTPVLIVIVLFVLLVGFGAALYIPKWLKAQRGESVD